jgi:hypothetical protein
MIQASLATPVALILVVGGLLACFAGYRLFRFVLGIYGFLLGAFITTAVTGSQDAWVMTMAVLVGGIVGAIMMILAYFVGVGLVGAGLAALVVNVAWRALELGDAPPTFVIVLVAVLGALGALSVAKFVVIFGTALAGSWTALIGGLAIRGDADAITAATTGTIWVLYPLDAGAERWWVLPVWLGMAGLGALIQLAFARGKKDRDFRRVKR